MVASEEEKVLRVLDLVGQQQTDGFQRLFASIHVVTKKKVVGIWWKVSIVKQPK